MALPMWRVAKTYSGSSPAAEQYTAGSTIAAGSLVVLSADGKIDIADDTEVYCLGIIMNAVVDTDLVTVYLAVPDTVFSGEGQASTGAFDDVGDYCDVGTGGSVDVATSTNDTFRIVGIDTTDSVGPNGFTRFLVTVNPLNSQVSQNVTLEA